MTDKEKIEVLTEALEAIVEHQKIAGGSMAKYSTTLHIAEQALIKVKK